MGTIINYIQKKYYYPNLLAFVLLTFVNFSFAQEIDLGPNNGKYIEVYDAKLYYETYGEGQPLLLLHGGLGSISTFKAVIPELSKHFKLIAIDCPGYFRS